jgi:hypothetical protein
MKKQEYIIASAASNKDAVDETEIINGIIENSYGLSPRENLFHNYSSDQLYSLSKELQNFLEAQGITLNPADNTQILTSLKKGILEWNATISYSQYDICKINNTIYVSKVNSNLNHNPVGDTTNWGGDLNITGNLTGTAYGTMKRIYSTVLNAPASTIPIPGLNGNDDIIYDVYGYFVMSGTCNVYYQFNGDTGNNYRIPGPSTTAYLEASANISLGFAFTKFSIYAKSGGRRLITGTDVSGDAVITGKGGWWTNTTDNLISILFYQSASETFQAGTRIEIYARR